MLTNYRASSRILAACLVFCIGTTDAAPLTVHPTNRRYFTDGSGKAVLLAGAHTWNNLQDMGPTNSPAAFNFNAYLDFLQSRNHNFIRLWSWNHVKCCTSLTLPIYAGNFPFLRTGPGTAIDGLPKFDLSLDKLDPAYFTRLRKRVQDAGARGIYVSIMLFEGWESRFGEIGGHPFVTANNRNGINVDTDGDGKSTEFYSLRNPTVTSLQEAYVRAVIDAVNDLDNVLYEISNETDPADSVTWQYHFIDFIRNYEATKPFQHPVGMTAGGTNDDNQTLYNSTADWISPTQAPGEPLLSAANRVTLLDTDHVYGLGGDALWIWKAFLRGHNPLYMDAWDNSVVSPGDGVADEGARHAMGDARTYATAMDLAAMTPQSSLASSGYILANPGNEYIALAANSSSISVNLSASNASFSVEWFDPIARTKTPGANVVGGTTRTFNAPSSKSNMVLYLKVLTTGAGACDLNGDGNTTVVDVQLSVNQAMGSAPCSSGDINKDGKCNVVDVQRLVNAALGGACVTQ